ncbi:uncharacterized protein LOC111255657 [Setaria italica]|nr:uncharacterized protein LOC111255657 [Setaria italica]XP_034603021.1 uncharacterized protein LOC117863433 [Setaria viridis]XP_034603022.1 uncharacterized protein LOC117863433 [Setaria viridis]
MEMESTIIVPSSSSSSVDSNIGPIALSSDDSGGDTNSNRLAAARKRKRLGPTYKLWGFGDERTILMELAAGLRESGRLPLPFELLRTLEAKGVLNRRNVTREEISSKLHGLKTKFLSAINKGGPGHKSRDQKLYELSKEVWPELLLKAPELI